MIESNALRIYSTWFYSWSFCICSCKEVEVLEYFFPVEIRMYVAWYSSTLRNYPWPFRKRQVKTACMLLHTIKTIMENFSSKLR